MVLNGKRRQNDSRQNEYRLNDCRQNYSTTHTIKLEQSLLLVLTGQLVLTLFVKPKAACHFVYNHFVYNHFL